MQKSVIEYLNRTAEEYPEKIAVHDAEEEITFAQLKENAKRLAAALQECVEVRQPVGVYIPKGCKMVTSFAAINMSADFYVPLDTKSPAARVKSIINTLEAKVVITDSAHEAALRAFFSGTILVFEDVMENKNIKNTDKNHENIIITKKEESSDIKNISGVTAPQSACMQASRQTDDPFRSTDIVAQSLSDDSSQKMVDCINQQKMPKNAENIQLRYECEQIDTDPVYSIFTSGSTGVPKGVVVSHRGVIDYIDWAIDTFHIDSSAVIGNQAPFYFDNSTLDIYLMYATGATLNVIPEINFAFPVKLIDYLNDQKITFVFWVPFVLVNVANMDILATKKPETLRDVFFAGEVMPNKHLNYWRKHLPECRYANLYGPTEITVDCTYYLVDREFSDDEPLPIGVPCRNSDVLILVDRQRRAAQGEQGELCVRGTSLALGYYNNPEKTKDAFIQNPLNTHYPETIYCTGDIVYENERGEIMYVGRVDSQIKHNGYRIELGEIETAILGSNLVDNCCVLYNNKEKQIVLVYQAEQELNVAVLRKAIGEKIPKYMLPTVYMRESSLRQNTSGKIDRAYYSRQVNS